MYTKSHTHKYTHTHPHTHNFKPRSLKRPKCLSNGKTIFLSTLLHHLRYLHSNCFRSLQVRICNLQGSVNNEEMIIVSPNAQVCVYSIKINVISCINVLQSGQTFSSPFFFTASSPCPPSLLFDILKTHKCKFMDTFI